MRERALGRWVALGATVASVACGRGEPPIVVGAVEFRGPEGSMAPHVAVAGGEPVLSWLESTVGEQRALRVAARSRGAWEVRGTPVENDSLFANWADFPSVAPLPDGRWLAHWLQKVAPSTYAYHVRLAVSPDAGRSWSEPFVPHGDRSPTEHGFVSIVPWGEGAALVWLDGRATAGGAGVAGGAGAVGGSRPSARQPAGPPAMTLHFTTIGADGIPAPDVQLDARVCDCCQTDLARTRAGLVAVYRDRTEDEIRDIAITRLENGAWTVPVTVADDGWRIPGCPVNGPQVAARGDAVVVAWFTASRDTARVLVGFSSDGGATFGGPVRIDGGRPTGRVDVIWWEDAALVAWLEESDQDGALRVRRVYSDGRAGSPVTVARTSTARAAGFPRMVLADDGVVIAWTAPGEGGGVRVATLRTGS